MTTLLLMASLAAVALLIHWVVRNDGAPTIEDQTGLFRMRVPDPRDNRTELIRRPRRDGAPAKTPRPDRTRPSRRMPGGRPPA